MNVRDFLACAPDMVSPGLSACQGCPGELVLRTVMKVIGSNSVLGVPPGCMAGIGTPGWGLHTGVRVPVVMPLLGNSAALMAGIKQAYDKKRPGVHCVAFAGDGATVDSGLQTLSAAAERNENIIYVCYDNEGYMNTGFQKSGTTPHGAAMSTSPVGKVSQGNPSFKKDVPLMMAMQDCAYVATLSPAFIQDFVAKVRRATEVTDGLSYLHVLAPCPTGWGCSPDQSIQVARNSVETLYFPLWEYDHGEFRLSKPTLRAAKKPRPVAEFIKGQKRFRHLSDDAIVILADKVRHKWAMLQKLHEANDTAEPVEGMAS